GDRDPPSERGPGLTGWQGFDDNASDMIGRATARIEFLVDACAAALLAAAVAYAVHSLAGGFAGTIGGGTLAFALSFSGLRRVEPEPRHFQVTDFVIQPV